MYKNPSRSRKVQAPGATKIVGKKKDYDDYTTMTMMMTMTMTMTMTVVG